MYQLGLWLAIFFSIFLRLPPNKFLRIPPDLSPVSIRLALLFLLLRAPSWPAAFCLHSLEWNFVLLDTLLPRCCDRRPLSGNRARYGRGAQGKGRKPSEPVCLQGPGRGAPTRLGRAGRGAAVSSSARKAGPRARTRAPSCQAGAGRRAGPRVRHAHATSFQSETLGCATSRRAAAGDGAARSEVK